MATINSERALAKGLAIALAKGPALALATGLAIGKHQRDLQSHQSVSDNAVHQEAGADLVFCPTDRPEATLLCTIVAGACLYATSYDRMYPGVLLKEPGVFLKDPGVLLKNPGVL